MATAIAALLLVSTPALAATTWHVNDSGDIGDASCEALPMECTLRDAVADADPGDTVVIDPAVDPSLTDGEILIDESLTISGQGAAATTINANDTSRVFNIGSVTPKAVLRIENLLITGGQAPNGSGPFGGPGDPGGAILNDATLTLVGTGLTGNRAGAGGIGAAPDTNGGTGGGGGAIRSNGPLTLIDSTISHNRAGAGGPTDQLVGGRGGSGGGLQMAADGTLTLIRSTVSGNRAGDGAEGMTDYGGGGNGGGIHSSGFIFTATNATISGNRAGGGGPGAAAGDGGGIYEEANDGATLIHVTVAGNSTSTGLLPEGGGIYRDAGDHLTISNSLIVEGPSSTTLCDGLPITDGGHNLAFGGPGCPGTATGNPLLAALASNGGPTQTMALGAGSPAIDAVPVADCAVATDQRGLPRPSGPACDIGAFEVQQPAPPAPLSLPLTATPAPPASARKKCKKGRKLKKGKCVKKKGRR